MRSLFPMLLAAMVLAAPAAAQQTVLTYVDNSGQRVIVTPAAPLPVTVVGGSTATRSTAPGTSDTQAVPVQGVTGGVPQNVQGTGTAGTPAAGVISVQGVVGGTAQNTAVTSSALPAGASTETTLAAMSGKLPASLGQKTAALSLSIAPALGTTSTTVAGTVTTANTYQSALAANANRRGCIIQNKSANLERLFLGLPASATDATAIDLAAGATFNCAAPSGFVLTDQVSISSATATSAFIVISQ